MGSGSRVTARPFSGLHAGCPAQLFEALKGAAVVQVTFCVQLQHVQPHSILNQIVSMHQQWNCLTVSTL